MTDNPVLVRAAMRMFESNPDLLRIAQTCETFEEFKVAIRTHYGEKEYRALAQRTIEQVAREDSGFDSECDEFKNILRVRRLT